MKASWNPRCTTHGLGFPQTKVITIVDREALDDDAWIFRREGGGSQRLNQMFAGELDQLLHQFQREVWAAA